MVFFSHDIDDATGYCVCCGKSLHNIQTTTKWEGNKVTPDCPKEKVIGISHLVRKEKVR